MPIITEENVQEIKPIEAETKPAVKRVKSKKGISKATKAKLTKAKAAPGQRGRVPLYTDAAKLKVLSKENPSREGTNAFDYFELARQSKTFGDYRAAGGNLRYLFWFANRDLVSIG